MLNPWDQTVRQVCKPDPEPFFAWVLRRFRPPPPLVFDCWDDTRRQPLPGGPDRTNDLIAIRHRTDQPEQLAYLLLEFETEPERYIFQRLGVYELLLSAELSAVGVAGEP
jgi:hypothetical protein